MKRRLIRTCVLTAGLMAWGAGSRAGIDPDLLAGMKARSIGPGGMSGRVAAVEAVVSDPRIIYVGAATGGVWKSTNGGLTWEPIFDDQPVAAVGAVTIFQPGSDLIWVGTGEGNPRNSASVGNGIYRSQDAGKTWTHMGLEKTERIHRIVLHPRDPEIAFVAALGRAWGENPERGVFKTTDGGQTWEKILYVDERTGAADLVMDPSNPDRLIAAMWDFRRWPWSFRSGGEGSGLFLTVDGGKTWKRLTEKDGLPSGNLGRIGISFCHNQPEIVYSLVEAEKSALLRSGDGGESWVKVNEETDVTPRPFYFSDIRVDPDWPQRVYRLWSLLSVSDDGGKSFRILAPFRDVHPDYHAMWIHPDDPRHVIVGNDGGVVISDDRGETWRFVSNLPLAQYYHIAVDMEIPYNVYGGMQDNGSWRGPSQVWENGGIRNHHWEEVGFGDGFDTRPHPADSLTGYAMSQEGYLSRWNLRTGERKDIRPPAPPDTELRFNWNAALALDPFDEDTVYYGSQFVHRSTDRGESWSVISPDLSTDNPDWQKQAESGGLTPDVTGAENFTTIVALAPSKVERGVLWAGTDDGRVHVTRNGGESWESLEGSIRGVPSGTWVPHIEPSAFDAGTAFVVLDNHRRSDWTPYVLKTTNFGKSWRSIATDDLSGYALAIVQDPVDPDLLFLGTEFGLYVTLDGGKEWLRWTHGLPTVSAMDLAIHPRDHDLIVGTHGRGAYVIDDIRPLRSVSKETLGLPVHLFEIPEALEYRVKQTGASRFPGHGEYRGTNRPRGALITFSMNVEGLPDAEQLEGMVKQERRERGSRRAPREEGEEEKGPIPKATIRILDGDGDEIRSFEEPVHMGVNRVVWNLRRDPFRDPPRERPWWFTEPRGPEVLPGSYTVKVEYEGHEAGGPVRVLPDPRTPIAESDREAKWASIERAGRLQETVAEAVSRILEVRSDAEVVARKIRAKEKKEEPDSGGDSELTDASKKLMEGLKALEEKLWVPPKTKGIVAEKDVLSKVSYVMGSLSSSWEAPTPGQIEYLDRAESLLEKVLAEFNDFFSKDVAEFRSLVKEAEVELLPGKEPLRLTR